ncbi:hypothetical protein [Mycobacterium sp.]|uniref:hypothetical protein n=1 Tax=Mycobacterium sp. TaxID=1785 RepID=UPI003A8934DE
MTDTPDNQPAPVDNPVAAVAAEPAMHRPREKVLVTGPQLAGASSVAAALRTRLPQHTFVEPAQLGPAEEPPAAVVFVVSAAAVLTESDCTLLDAAAALTDSVVGVVAKTDVHYPWREVLEADVETVSGHAPRYGRMPWVGVAAAPEVGEAQVEELVACVGEELTDPGVARRNRLRARESRLRTAARRLDRDAEGAGRQARADALRERRGTLLRGLRQSRARRAIAVRGRLQRTRLQAIGFARDRCSSLRTELQEEILGLSRRATPEFEGYARRRLADVAADVADYVDTALAEVADIAGVRLELSAADPLPAATNAGPPRADLAPTAISADSARAATLADSLPTDLPPTVPPPPPPASRRVETRLVGAVGAVFGLGVALTLTRLVAGPASHVRPGVAQAVVVACVLLGLVAAVWMVRARGLLSDRAMLDRWTGEVVSSLRSACEQLVAGRVLAVESLLNAEIAVRDEGEDARVAEQVEVIDAELRTHIRAAERAAAVRDREMAGIRAALDAVAAELGDPPAPGARTRADAVGMDAWSPRF